MEILKAILLGIVQGLTEFLPVSSSGHLAIFQHLFKMNDAGVAFDVFLHVGTLVAICAVFWNDVAKLIVNGCGIIADAFYNLVAFIKSKIRDEEVEYRKIVSSSYRKFAMLVIVSTIPTGIIGMLGKKIVNSMSNSLIGPGLCLILTAILLWVSDQYPEGKKTPKKMTYLDALFIGLCQGIATIPGLSRSGTTITAGLMAGLKREFAVKYSFLMSIPAIIGAAIVEIPDMKSDMAGTGFLPYLFGMIFAGVVGYFCIKFMLVFIKKRAFKVFSVYCAAVGLIAVIASFFVK